MDALLILLVIAAGCLMPLQAAINAMLGQAVGGPYLSGFFSFLVGALALLLVCCLQRLHWPDVKTLAEFPLWIWSGGLLGACFVVTGIVAVARLGTATMMALFLAGQMIMALAMDHFGWLGVPTQPLSWLRVLGAVLLFIGVILIRKF